MSAIRGARLARRTLHAVVDTGAALAAGCLGAVVLAYGYEVVLRYFFAAPTGWVNSIAVYLTLAAAMLMLPFVTRERQHVAIDFLRHFAPASSRHAQAQGVSLVSALTCLAAAWFALSETARQLGQGVRTTDTLALPRWWITAFVVYGLAGAGLVFLQRFLDHRRTPDAG